MTDRSGLTVLVAGLVAVLLNAIIPHESGGDEEGEGEGEGEGEREDVEQVIEDVEALDQARKA